MGAHIERTDGYAAGNAELFNLLKRTVDAPPQQRSILLHLAKNEGGAVSFDELAGVLTHNADTPQYVATETDLGNLAVTLPRARAHVPAGWELYTIAHEMACVITQKQQEGDVVEGPRGFRMFPDFLADPGMPLEIFPLFQKMRLTHVGHRQHSPQLKPIVPRVAYEAMQILAQKIPHDEGEYTSELGRQLSLDTKSLIGIWKDLNSFFASRAPQWHITLNEGYQKMELRK